MQRAHSAIPRVGEPAPNFTLKDTDMKSVSLQSFRGKTLVLSFFPAAFSSVCTSELCTFSEHMPDINEANAQILGISVDLPYTLKQFKQSKGLTFPLLSDFDRHAIESYGIVDRDFNGYNSGVAQRSVFVVDPLGSIVWAWVSGTQGEHPEYGDVLRAAGALEF
ncbi:MAG: peroxiredoxin [Chloroflexota bacterium]